MVYPESVKSVMHACLRARVHECRHARERTRALLTRARTFSAVSHRQSKLTPNVFSHCSLESYPSIEKSLNNVPSTPSSR